MLGDDGESVILLHVRNQVVRVEPLLGCHSMSLVIVGWAFKEKELLFSVKLVSFKIKLASDIPGNWIRFIPAEKKLKKGKTKQILQG